MKFVAVFALLALCTFAFPFKNLRAANSKVGDVVFTPAKLPCKSSISMEINGTKDGHLLQVLYVDGEIFGVEGKDYTGHRFSIPYTEVRMDVESSEGVTIFVGRDEGSCQPIPVSKETARSYLEDSLATFTEQETFVSVNETTFMGKKCKAYYKHAGMDLTYYVDEDDYIFAIVAQDSKDYDIAVITYNFDFSLDVFALDRKRFPGCDSKAYTAPQEQC